MRRICPFLLLVALAAAGCASCKPSVQTSAVALRTDSMNMTVDCLSAATLHDVTVIPADTTRDIVHIGKVELDRHTHMETVAVSNETTAESRTETPPPAPRSVPLRWMPWIFLIAAGAVILLRK